MTSAICRRYKARAAETGEHIVFECKDIYRRSLRRRYIAGARTWTDLDKPRIRPKEGVGGLVEAEEDTVESFFAAILRRPVEKEAESEQENGGNGEDEVERDAETETETETEAEAEAETEAEHEERALGG